jgi:peptidoglycan/xylan/chitin deacetylase (PgdA/CDA1 family)
VTDAVLDLLEEKEAKATFFVVGTQLRRPGGSDLAGRARSEGHWIGHHTQTHTVLLGAAADPDAAVRREIAEMAPDLESLNTEAKLFRPYAAGGVLDHRVLSRAAVRHLQRHHYTCVLWNSVPHDWDDPDGWVERALADASTRAHTVVVLHDLPTGAMDHLGRFIDSLRDTDIDIVQGFPDDCVPIRDGNLTQTVDHLIPPPRPDEPTTEA